MNTEQYEEDMQRDAAHEGQGASADPMLQTDTGTTSAGETAAPRKRAPRRKAAEADAADAGTPAPRTRRRKTAAKDDAEGVPGAEGAGEVSAEESAAKTAKRVSRSRRKPAADAVATEAGVATEVGDAVSADAESADAEGASVEAEARPRRARTPRASTRRSKVASAEGVTATEVPVSEDGLSDASASVAPMGEASDDGIRAGRDVQPSSDDAGVDAGWSDSEAPSFGASTDEDDFDDDDFRDEDDRYDDEDDFDDEDDGEEVPGEPVPFFAREASIGLRDAGRGTRRPVSPDAEKLHKILADAGIGSRRDMEELIIAGRVSVNGLPAHVGQRVGPEDVIRVNGKPLSRRRSAASQTPQVLLYHKPTGELVTRDDPGSRPKVFDRLPRLRGARWIAVGRLDLNSEGLLIFTTSGDLANKLMHPRYGWEREYAVRVLGRVDDEIRQQLLTGVTLEDGPATLQSIEDIGGEGANHWYRVVILEGRNREVRRLFDAVGLTVSRLVRIRFGPIALPPRLQRGRLHALTEAEVRQLQQQMRRHVAEMSDGAADAVPARGGKSGNVQGRGKGAARGNDASRRQGRGAGKAVQAGAGQQGSGQQGAASGSPQPSGSRHPARRRMLRGARGRAQQTGEGMVQLPGQDMSGMAMPTGQVMPVDGNAAGGEGQPAGRRTRGGRRKVGQEAAGAQQAQRARRGNRRQAAEGGLPGDDAGKQARGKRQQPRRSRTAGRQQSPEKVEAPRMVSVKTLEPTAEKKTLTVSERRGWTETRYLPQAVSYSGDTDWSKVARETVLPDRRPRRVKERNGNVAPRSGKGSGRNGNVAPRNRQAPATGRINYEDDDWQPTSDSAHLEGITRSMKRDGRQQRWGATPGFAARLGQPFDPNAGSGNWGGQRAPGNGTPRQPRAKRAGGNGGNTAQQRPRRKSFAKGR